MAIIVDDERLASSALVASLLENHPEIEILDEATNADEAVEKIDQQNA